MASSSSGTVTSVPATFVTASGPTIATQNAVQQKRGPDTLDKTVTFLAKRDGIDKASDIPTYHTESSLEQEACNVTV